MNADSIAQRTIAPSQARRRKDAKDSQRHHNFLNTDFTDDTDFSDRAPSGDSRRIGRTATAPGRGIEARKTDRQTHALAESAFLHLGSFLRNAHPASVDSRSSVSSALSLPQCTSREGIKPSPTALPSIRRGGFYTRPRIALNLRMDSMVSRAPVRPPTCHPERVSPRASRKVPRGNVGRSFPLRDERDRIDLLTLGRSFDSAASEAAPLKMTGLGAPSIKQAGSLLHNTARRNCGAGILPAHPRLLPKSSEGRDPRAPLFLLSRNDSAMSLDDQ